MVTGLGPPVWESSTKISKCYVPTNSELKSTNRESKIGYP